MGRNVAWQKWGRNECGRRRHGTAEAEGWENGTKWRWWKHEERPNMGRDTKWGAKLGCGPWPQQMGARWSLGARASARGNREQVGGKES